MFRQKGQFCGEVSWQAAQNIDNIPKGHHIEKWQECNNFAIQFNSDDIGKIEHFCNQSQPFLVAGNPVALLQARHRLLRRRGILTHRCTRN